jgi:hypothetical protein
VKGLLTMFKTDLLKVGCWIAVAVLASTAKAQEKAAPKNVADGAHAASPTEISATKIDSVADNVQHMERALTEVSLLVEAARAERKPDVMACLVQRLGQIGKHLRFAKKVEVEQYDAAIRLKDPGAPDIARSVARRLTMVMELRAQAAACAGAYNGYLAGETVLEFETLPSQDTTKTAFVYGTVTVDSRPPAASPYQ